MITGMGTRLEIWTPDEWFAEDEENAKLTPELTESLALTQSGSAPAPGSAQ